MQEHHLIITKQIGLHQQETDACDDPKILDGIGDPSNLTTSANLHDGSITIDWDAATEI